MWFASSSTNTSAVIWEPSLAFLSSQTRTPAATRLLHYRRRYFCGSPHPAGERLKLSKKGRHGGHLTPRQISPPHQLSLCIHKLFSADQLSTPLTTQPIRQWLRNAPSSLPNHLSDVPYCGIHATTSAHLQIQRGGRAGPHALVI